MYYPYQIPNLLNNEFKDKIEYIEYKYKDFEKHIMCIWTMKSYNFLDNDLYNIILPDGCIDLIIDLENKKIGFSAFSKATEYFKLCGKVNHIGIRFKPGIFYNIFKYNCYNVMDNFVSYDEIEKEISLENIFNYTETKEHIETLKNYLYKKIVACEEDVFLNLFDKIYEDLTFKYIKNISEKLGYSTKQTNRIFKRNFGVAPKTLLNILRLHKCLSLLLDNNKLDLTDLAISCGFYDQAHFTKEINKYCGISPTKLIERYNI